MNPKTKQEVREHIERIAADWLLAHEEESRGTSMRSSYSVAMLHYLGELTERVAALEAKEK